MRTRDNIEQEAKGTGDTRYERLSLEVLLDIRDLLERTSRERRTHDADGFPLGLDRLR